MGVTGWWAEIHASFGLTLSPTLGFSPEGNADTAFGLSLTPSIGMAASGTSGVSEASFGLSFTPQIGMGTPRSADFAVSLTPQIGMAAGERYARSFGLSFTPQVGMAASGLNGPPLSIVGAPIAVGGDTVTLPTHAVGDLIVLYAFRRTDATNAITKPTAAGTVPAWVDIDTNAGANACMSRSAFFVATANNHTSGAWTSAEGMSAIVIRYQHSTPIGGHAESGGTGTAAVAPAITMANTDGTSMVLHFHATRMNTTWAAAPAGYTRRAAMTVPFLGGVCLNTKDDTTSDGSVSQGTQTSSGYRGQTIEIRSH